MQCLFQELAGTLARDVLPALQQRDVRMLCVGIGTLETARSFCEHVQFPPQLLFADAENEAYSALGLEKGLATTFFSVETPFAILKRLQKDGAKDLLDATARWRPWLPPKSDQGLQQGGAFVFEGDVLRFAHNDPSTGAHADLDAVVNAALAN